MRQERIGTANTSVRRFKRARPCPICGGYDEAPRRKGVRCYGFLSSDGEYAHCSRGEYAGALPLEADANTYAHRLAGTCRCGKRHDSNPHALCDVRRREVKAYPYHDETGRVLFEVVRYDPKGFAQRRPKEGGGYTWSLDGVRQVLYQLPVVIEAVREGDPVYIAEGEKDCDALELAGVAATTNPMGAGKWHHVEEHARTVLADARVRVVADRDAEGRAHAQAVAASLEGFATSVEVLEPARGKDAAELLAIGGTLEELVPISGEERQELEGYDAGAGIQYLDLEKIKAEGIPPIRWLLPGWLAERDIAVVAGAGGIGKSTLVSDLAVAIASARPWCGVAPTRQGSVLFFDEEQGDEQTARTILRLGAPVPGLKVASGQGIRLDTPEGIALLEHEIAAAKPALVVLDSVQQTFGGAKENDATEIGAVYRGLFQLRDRYGVTFLLVHHKKKSQGYQVDALELVRGSTAHGTQAATVWYAYPGPGGDRLNLRQVKRRGAPKLSLIVAYDAEGEDGPITLTGEGAVAEAETALERASELIVERLADRGPCRWAELKQAGPAAKVAERTLKRARDHLLKVGSISSPKRGWYELIAGRSSGHDDAE